jgi:hypothetical protein
VVRRFALLSEQQVKVLRWVADGCPDGAWKDFSYKRTACALADRGLVTVDRRRHTWRATITEGGRFYLNQGIYRDVEAVSSRRAVQAGSQSAETAASVSRPAPFVTAESLLAELSSTDGGADGPGPSIEGARGISVRDQQAITDGVVPHGCGLRHTGRDGGDLVIRLVSLDEPARARPLPAVPVPVTVQGRHEAVMALCDSPDLLDVSSTRGNGRCRSLRRSLLSAHVAATGSDCGTMTSRPSRSPSARTASNRSVASAPHQERKISRRGRRYSVSNLMQKSGS